MWHRFHCSPSSMHWACHCRPRIVATKVETAVVRARAVVVRAVARAEAERVVARMASRAGVETVRGTVGKGGGGVTVVEAQMVAALAAAAAALAAWGGWRVRRVRRVRSRRLLGRRRIPAAAALPPSPWCPRAALRGNVVVVTAKLSGGTVLRFADLALMTRTAAASQTTT